MLVSTRIANAFAAIPERLRIDQARRGHAAEVFMVFPGEAVMVRRPPSLLSVIPAQAGIQCLNVGLKTLDPSFRWDDERRRKALLLPVIPAQAGIQCLDVGLKTLDPSLRWDDERRRKAPLLPVIPAQAGIQCLDVGLKALDPSFRWDDERRRARFCPSFLRRQESSALLVA